MQTLVTEAKKTLGLSEGEFTMFIADQPAISHDMQPVVLVAEVKAAQQQSPHVMGVCGLVKVGPYGSGQADLDPILYANSYYFKAKTIKDSKIDYATAEVTVLKQPKHGYVEPVMQDGDWRDARYVPNDGYLGNDSFSIQVEGNGYKVQFNYFMYVTEGAGESEFENKACKGHTWKISASTSEPDLINWQQQSAWPTFVSNFTKLSNVSIAFADLTGASVGSSTGTGTGTSGKQWGQTTVLSKTQFCIGGGFVPRRTRLELTNVPLHLIQSGNNREACLFKKKISASIWSSLPNAPAKSDARFMFMS